MNEIKRFFTKTADVKRQQKQTDGSGNKYSDFGSVGTVDGHLQQARPEVAENLNLDFTETYTWWCDENADIQKSDTLTIDSEDYSVEAIQRNETGNNQHLEIILQKP